MAAQTQELALRDAGQQAVAVRSSQITDVQRLGGLLAASGYFSDAREMAQAAVKVLAGEELGIPPVAAMMGINIIKGKIALGGNLIASRIRAHGFDFVHKQFDATGCVLIFLGRKGEENRGHGMLAGRPILGESSFNEADYKAAQIQNDGYRKYPRNMYFNRAISNGAKWYTPEVFAGAPVYVPEELGATVDENGDMVHPEPVPEQQSAARDAVRDRKLAEIRNAPPTPAPPAETESAAKESTEPAQNQPQEVEVANGIKARLEQFAKIKEMIGADKYYSIIGAHGFEHANEIRDVTKARAIYREMAAAFDAQQRGTA